MPENGCPMGMGATSRGIQPSTHPQRVLDLGEFFGVRDILYDIGEGSPLFVVQVVDDARGGDEGEAAGVPIALAFSSGGVGLAWWACHNEVNAIGEAVCEHFRGDGADVVRQPSIPAHGG